MTTPSPTPFSVTPLCPSRGERQEEHHRRFDLQMKLRGLLAAHSAEYDERYVWD